MFTKPLAQLTYNDIDDLVNIRQEREGYFLDYKGEISNPDKAKNELAKDISAFANSGGGYLIMGVDKEGRISGVSGTIQNRNIDEWINQVLSSNIDPQVYYEDPKVIPVPDSEKVVVIIHVPESTRKPHMTTGLYTYFTRINDSCKAANHSQVREMFDYSRNRTDEFNQFLQMRNLYDVNSENFGLSKNSQRLYSPFPEGGKISKPVILFSLIPKFPNEEKIRGSLRELTEWMERHSRGYEPNTSQSLFYTHSDREPMLDGVIFKRRNGKDITSYFEILNNGFIEAGLSSTVSHYYEHRDAEIPATEKIEKGVFLTHIITYEMLILGFARKFYEYIKYFDEVLFQVSFVNVLNLRPYAIHNQYDFRHMWRMPYNTHHKNFKLIHRFNIRSLSDAEILSVAKDHSERMCRAFGLDGDYCFINDKLERQHVYDFSL